MMNADKAPSFDEMVREGKAVTLGEAKQYAAALPAEKRRTACGCYTCSAPACPACCFPTCLVNFCGGCLMYNPFMCACPDSSTPGAWTCTDMKGITNPHPNPIPNMHPNPSMCPDTSPTMHPSTRPNPNPNTEGITYFLVPVDETGSLGCWSGWEVKDSQKTGCYFTKRC